MASGVDGLVFIAVDELQVVAVVGKEMALAVRAQREEVVIGVRRIDGGLDRAEAGVADGSRRQTGIDIGVVWAVDLRVESSRRRAS